VEHEDAVFWFSLAGGLLSAGVLWALQLGTLLSTIRRRAPALARPGSPDRALPPISVLKPLKGSDAELRENLGALLEQDYPEYEVLFAVEDPDDPAVAVARAVMREHPERRTSLHIGGRRVGMNPKVSNLVPLAMRARYELFLISDADVRPPRDYLKTLARELEAGADLVHNLPVITRQRTLGAVLEGLQMNAFVVATLCGAELARHNCVVGKSMLFRKAHLHQVGGFDAVRDVLAEDYVLGDLFRRAGLRVRLSSMMLPVVQPERALSSFVNRHLRWAQMRRWVCLRAYVCEPFANPVAWLVVGWPLAHATTWGARYAAWVGVALLVLCLKCFADSALVRVVSGRWVPLRHLALIPVKDLLIALVWWVGLFDRRVNWRGNVMTIGPGSSLSPLRQAVGPRIRAARV
jgi:ceramide glucosyltransferase